ncbi:PqqD family protein [Dehalobacter restrictus]|uniref:PqqD family peptide modification chaperone n=1 Tax=Dehalobacter restrictus TaxID=55583 RepID=A0A857DJR0_9FIRM|nr:PqqD family protein [Dehalobacter restrictus]QHA00951.1 PqqD family peptide modification chaperone [Dehalobacter restrictus]
MKIKEGYLVREIANCYIVVPVGERVIEFKGIMTLNDTGNFIWRCLTEDISYNQLLASILDEYEIDEVIAKADLDDFIQSARENGVLEE